MKFKIAEIFCLNIEAKPPPTPPACHSLYFVARCTFSTTASTYFHLFSTAASTSFLVSLNFTTVASTYFPWTQTFSTAASTHFHSTKPSYQLIFNRSKPFLRAMKIRGSIDTTKLLPFIGGHIKFPSVMYSNFPPNSASQLPAGGRCAKLETV